MNHQLNLPNVVTSVISLETLVVLLLNAHGKPIERFRPKRIVIAICVLLAAIGGLYVFGADMLRGLFFGGSGKQIAPSSLTSVWEYPDDRQDAGMTSFVKRGELCIASTAEAVLAIEMKTGVIRWTNAQLPQVIIKPQSDHPALPLIAVRQEYRGETVIMRIDPDSGQTLWQQTLPLAFAEVTFDEQTIAAYAGRTLSALDLNGQTLWTKRVGGKADISYAQWHSGLLIGQFQDKPEKAVEITLRYLDRMTGAVIWEQEDGQEYPRYVVEKDRQIFSQKEGRTALIHLPDQARIWESGEAISDIVAQDDTTLYAMTAAFDKQTGRRRFDYPAGSAFSGLSTAFVFALQEINPQKKLLLIIDKISGKVKQSIEHRAWYFAKYLTEDDRALYLAMYSKPERADSTEIRSELARIDKQTFAATSFSVGSNPGMLYFEVFTQERLVFIPSFQRLGGYALSER